jgi:hypothetical protein
LRKLVAILILFITIISCTKETANIELPIISTYYPLEVGKSITYKLDSTVYLNLGTIKEIRSYIIQDRVDAIINDNSGRPSYKVKRMLRNSSDSTKWQDLTSYLVTIDEKQLELVDKNLRFIILKEPIRDNFSWKGNSFINTISFPEFQFLDQWEYKYENVGKPFLVNGQTFPETISIIQQVDTLGSPQNKSFYYEIIIAKEVYAKNIGLISKEFFHETWQPPNANSNIGYYEANSYGIKLSIIKSN